MVASDTQVGRRYYLPHSTPLPIVKPHQQQPILEKWAGTGGVLCCLGLPNQLWSTRITSGSIKKCTHGPHVNLHKMFTNGLLLSTRITGGSYKKCTHGLHVTLHNYIYKRLNCNPTFLPPLLFKTLSYCRNANQYFKLELLSPNVHIS